VYVEDEGEKPLVQSPYSVNVKENEQTSSIVATLKPKMSDKDYSSPENITWTILSRTETFEITDQNKLRIHTITRSSSSFRVADNSKIVVNSGFSLSEAATQEITVTATDLESEHTIFETFSISVTGISDEYETWIQSLHEKLHVQD
jgi:DNA polymerase II large subunit